MMKNMNKKAFTLIELLVVIAVIGILVLLGAPRFTGYTQKAEDARIQHDIKVMEQEVGTMLINGDDDFNKWENNINDLNQLVQEDKLFEKEGPVVANDGEPIDGSYKIIPEKYKDKINTKLKGTFYANSDGKVYYEHGKGPGYYEKGIEDLIAEGYIPVATAEDLNSVRSDAPRIYAAGTEWETENEVEGGLDKKYVQVADIDLSGYGDWTPIGNYDYRVPGNSLFFTGTYDGGNYDITGLRATGSERQGLFGYTHGATISNVDLKDVNVTGRSWVGGLVGWASNTKISNSHTTGSVKASNSQAGGLAGRVESSTTISNSYSTVTVTGKANVGGLVGLTDINIGDEFSDLTSSNIIENSYFTGSVTGESWVGGLVGSASENSTTINNSYTTGLVTGKFDYITGGLIGKAYPGVTVTNSYWDKETMGQTSSSGGGEGKTTDEMMNQATYSGWDFTNIWEITPGNYPTLR